MILLSDPFLKCTARVFECALYASAIVVGGSLSQAQELTLEGTYKKTVHFVSGKSATLPAVEFTVNLKDCEWRIRCVQNVGPNSSDYKEASYDGTNIYYLNNFERAVEAQKQKGPNMAPNIALAYAYRGEVCNIEQAGDISPIWLTYASGCYFSRQSNNLVEPAFSLDPVSAMRFGPPEHNKMKAEWALTNSGFNFLSHLAYLSDGRQMQASGSFVQFAPPYDKGFSNSYYEVLSYTNVGNVAAPLVSRFTVYIPKIGGKTSADLQSVAEFEFVTTSVHGHVEDTPFQLALPGATLISDLRAAVGPQNPVVYYTSNKWQSIEELRKNQLPLSENARLPVGITRFVLLVCLIVPLTVISTVWIKNKNTTTD